MIKALQLERLQATTGAVLYDDATAEVFGPIFPDIYDAERFLRWADTSSRRMAQRYADAWLGRGHKTAISDWPKCSRCGRPAEPGHQLCDDCECDAEYEAEQAKGAA